MSKRYSSDHKNLVLRILYAYRGDIVTTSRFTGIPERTLRDWQKEYEWELQMQQQRRQSR